MLDLTILDEYIEPISDFWVKYLEHEVAERGKDEVLAQQFINLDCSRIVKGYRMQQTIGYTYVCEITKTLYVIQTWFADELDDKLLEVITLHNKNLEFEKLNPPIIYGGKRYKNAKNKQSKKVGKVRQTRIKFDENGEPVKSAAELRLAAKIQKINALKINLKPA